MPACRYMEENGSAVMLATMRPVSVTSEMNLRGHVTYMPLPSANKAALSGFGTQRRHHQKSRTAVSVAPQKGLMSSKILNFFLKILAKLNIYMSYFAYACKTEGKNGISCLISELLRTLDSSSRDRLFDVTEWRTVAYPGDFRIP